MNPLCLHQRFGRLLLLLGAVSLSALGASTVAQAAPLTIPPNPLASSLSAKPLTMLIAGRDHRLFYEAYNDASDIDGDGVLDVRFKPGIQYFGLFDSDVCYEYSGTPTSNDNGTVKNAELWKPVSAVTSATLRNCTGTGAGQWSGNWLNYLTTSRIDALRKVLYGGHREVDTSASGSTESSTVLRRAYIPQDAHSWGKEYHNETTDGYRIADYTALSAPSDTRRRHFFGNLTATNSVNCSTLSNCSNRPPLLRMRLDVQDRRIWEWASKERPVLDSSLSSGSFQSGSSYAERNYAVRVQVCTTAFTKDCKRYPNGSLKPIGLLHEYGESDAMLFGLITGSYDRHMTGGRLRKVVSSFAGEINPTSGVFRTGASAPIVTSFNNLRIRGFNQSSDSNEYAFKDPYTASAKAPTEGEFVDWGNPVGEMMLEGLRYFAGARAASAGFDRSDQRTIDAAVGLSSASWDDPYASNSTARAQYCARPNFLIVSNINPSFDSDSMPGSSFASYSDSLGNLSGLNVTTVANAITGIENRVATSTITGRNFFIGQSTTADADNAPTPKTLNQLGTVRGLAPDETGKQGSFYSAALAYWAKTNNIRTDLRNTYSAANVNIDSYVVALSSPLPTIEVPINGRKISLVPFAKSVSGNSISNARTAYQPTNQIVDFYLEEFTQGDTSTGAGYRAVFQINFEDVEQGGDHDMDAIAKYTIAVVNNQLQVKVEPTYQAGGIQQHMGFVVSGVTDSNGTARDGVYLVARDENNSPAYYLNVPPNRWAGYCNFARTQDMPADCATLPSIGSTAHTYVFRPNTSGTSAQLLKDPLWYVAKYGGYVKEDDETSTGVGPTRRSEWDSLPSGTSGDGVPDNYFLVQNPLNLKTSLRNALENISANSASGGNVVANSTRLDQESYAFQATFNNRRWSGDVLAYRVSSSGVAKTADWSAAANLPKNSNTRRNIYYGTQNRQGSFVGKSFLLSELSATEKGYLGASDAEALRVLDYLRGSDANEFAKGGGLRDRSATTVLGDIAHSSPAYSKDSGTVFVGSNSGMLHAFSTQPLSTSNNVPPGSELFAYVPSVVLQRLRNLTTLGYNTNHEYFVDGDVAVSARVGNPARNYLVAALGRGGKGLFGLDVTDPARFSASDVKWEYFPPDTDEHGRDLGLILGRPVIAKAANGVDVVIVGNGYNSTSEAAALFVLNLANGQLIRKLRVPTTTRAAAGGNGLAMPGVFDANNDSRIDVAYAGDLYGQVWRFDLSNSDPANWSVSNAGAPIFLASDAAGNPQPITAPMTVAVNSVSVDPNFNKRFVFFGTGIYIQQSDKLSTGGQTFYSIVDDPASPHTGRNQLRERRLSARIEYVGRRDPSQPVGPDNPAVNRIVRTLSAQTAPGDMSERLGCFVDLPEWGERIVTRANLYRLAEPTLIVSSIIPESVDQCVPGGRGYVNALSPFTCARLAKPFFDLNRSGSFIDDALPGGEQASSIGYDDGQPGEAIIIGDQLVVNRTDGQMSSEKINTGALPLRGRLSWREIVRD